MSREFCILALDRESHPTTRRTAMKKPAMSQVFDSDLQFVDPQEFDEIVMAEVELFTGPEFDEIVNDLQSWDMQSLKEIQESMFRFLITRQGKDLKLSTNLVLDHCMREGKADDFKIYLLTNTLDWLIACREFEAMKAMASSGQSEEQE